MLHWSLEEKRLELIYNWKISRNESSHKVNFFIQVTGNNLTGNGEVAPNIRYEETPEKIKSEFNQFLDLKPEKVQEPDALDELLNEINISNALRFGIESAFLHWYILKRGLSVYNYFQIPMAGRAFTSYTIPIMEPGEVIPFIQKYNLGRFKSLKIKISTHELDLIKNISQVYDGPLRIDANEAWKDPDSLLVFLEKIKHLPVEFIEQPFAGTLKDEYRYLKKKSPYPVLGDESITSHPDMKEIAGQFHGINMKLMKAGGYRNGIRILKEAQKLGLKTMIGCMVETTLGISSALNLAGLSDYIDLDGHFVLANEPFKLVKEVNGELFFNNQKA